MCFSARWGGWQLGPIIERHRPPCRPGFAAVRLINWYLLSGVPGGAPEWNITVRPCHDIPGRRIRIPKREGNGSTENGTPASTTRSGLFQWKDTTV